MTSTESVFEVEEVPENPDGLGGGNFVDAEGRFHVFVTGVDTEKFLQSEANELRHFVFEMTVLNGEDKTQVDKTMKKRVFIERWIDRKNQVKEIVDEKKQKAITYLLMAFGVFQPGQKASVSKESVESLVDKHAVVLVRKGNDWEKTNEDGTKTKMEGRHEMRWENDCWAVTHEDVARVPMDAEMLAAGGIVLPAGQSAHAGQQAAADPLAGL